MSEQREQPVIEPIQWVDAAEVLPHEALDFTPWLADNLDVLAAALGFDGLDLEEVEYRVGDYRLDILAAGDVAGERFPVAIENQYGSSDHRHLGQLLTYLASQERGWAVWIVEDASQAHQAAVEFLNRTTDAEAEFGYALVRVRFTPGEDAHQVFLEVLDRPNTFVRDQRSRRSNPERSRFLGAVYDLIADPLAESGWDEVELFKGGRVIRLYYPPAVGLDGYGFTHIRAWKNFSYVHIFINQFDEAESNTAAIDVLRERYGEEVSQAMPDNAEIEWNAGRPQDTLDACKITFDGHGYASDPKSAAPLLQRACQGWLEVLRSDPLGDLDAEVASREP